MSLTLSEKSNAGYDPIPAGTHIAVCCAMVDIGSQWSEQYKNASRKVMIGWEIPGETITIDGEERPRTIYKRYTASLNPKARLRKDLEAWRGKAFTDQELAAFDLVKIVGTGCMLTVIHREFNSKIYSDVAGVSSLIRGIDPPNLSEPALVFDLDSASDEDINKLPEWIQKLVKNSETYKERTVQAPELEEIPPEDDLESIPF